MSIDPDSKLPKYYQLKRIILDQVEKGRFPQEQPIPSESEMMRQYGVSRFTVRQAIGELVNEGRLRREQGRGTVPVARRANAADRARNVGFVSAVLSAYIFPQIAKGIQEVLTRHGYGLLLGSTDGVPAREGKCLLNMLDNGVRGLIVELTRSARPNPNLRYFARLRQEGIPYVMIDSYVEELKCPHVTLDDELGGWLATRHLVELGHTRIGMVYKSTHGPAVRRLAGYAKALAQAGITFDEDLVRPFAAQEDQSRPGYRVTRELLKLREKRPTGVFYYNDQCAAQGLRAIWEAGLRIPADISVVGFDNSELAVVSEVQLTSVEHPKEEMGRKAAEILTTLVESGDTGENRQDLSYVFKPALVVRDSCRAMR